MGEKESPYGEIAVRWELKDSRLNLQVSVPAGVTATVCTPKNAVICQKDGKKINIEKGSVAVEAGEFAFEFLLQ